jgi:hypothetical protein
MVGKKMPFSKWKMSVQEIGPHDAIRSFGEAQSSAPNPFGESNKNCNRLVKFAAIGNIDFPPESNIDRVIRALLNGPRADNCSVYRLHRLNAWTSYE